MVSVDEGQYEVEDAVVVQIASDKIRVIDAVEPADVAVTAAIAPSVVTGRDPQFGMTPEEFVDRDLLLRGEDIVVRLGSRGGTGTGERTRPIGLSLRERSRGLAVTAGGGTGPARGDDPGRARPRQAPDPARLLCMAPVQFQGT